MVVFAAVLVLSTLTSFVQGSPVHSESWWPLLMTWGTGLAIGSALLGAGNWDWGAAWTIGTVGGVVARRSLPPVVAAVPSPRRPRAMSLGRAQQLNVVPGPY